jgi:group I intron endonuclease
MMGIYQIENKINNKVYIGSSVDIIKRWADHVKNLKYGTHTNYKLQKDYKTYGISVFSFSVLEIVESKNDLFDIEQTYLDSLDINSNYNILSYSTWKYNSEFEESYDIVNFQLELADKLLLKKNLTIIKNEKLNLIGKDKTALSKAWYNKNSVATIKRLKNNLFNFYQTTVNKEAIYWTSFTIGQNDMNSKGLIKRYISLVDKPKIKCNNLAYLANNFINPNIQRATNINSDDFAINILLKWIVSVADILDPINIYIPSSRMRNLLIDWLDKLSGDVVH